MLPRRSPLDTAAPPAARSDVSRVRGASPGVIRGALLALTLAVATSPLSGQRDTTPRGSPAAIVALPVVDTPTAAWRVVLPGDALRLVIWREPDLSGDFVVDENGVVTLPKVGAIAVGTQDGGVLRRRVVAAFQPFLTHSSIEVTVLRRVQVTGAVRTPGVYRIDPTMTLGDALALAGGVTSDGNPDRLELLRRGERVGARLRVRTQIAETQVRSGDQIYVPERRWSSRRITLVAAALGTGATLVAVMRR